MKKADNLTVLASMHVCRNFGHDQETLRVRPGFPVFHKLKTMDHHLVKLNTGIECRIKGYKKYLKGAKIECNGKMTETERNLVERQSNFSEGCLILENQPSQ